MDLLDKCYSFTRADEIKALDMYPYFTPIQEVKGNKVFVRGREMIMVGSNNYLGLLEHPQVKAAARAAIDRYGVATCGSRFLNGTLDLHVELEEQLAKFMKREAVQTFSTGFQTNLGIITSIVDREKDVIIADRQVHASIVDACRLSGAKVLKYKHNDMEDLEKIMASAPGDAGKLIVVDGVFSMEGDLAPLPEIIRLGKKYGARIMSDEAHGIGVMGKNGRGTPEHFGVEKDIDLVMGTFSKSFASLGGFVAGDAKVISYIKHHARSLIFSASITPASAASVIAALEIIESEPERRENLWRITRKMKAGFEAMGYDTGRTETPIIPLFIRDDERAFMLWKCLRENGIFANPVIYPAVPPGESLIRTSYSATHSDEELDQVLVSFNKCGRLLGIIK